MTNQITPARRKELAQTHGLNEQYLYQCLTGRRDMNPEEAVRVEKLTDGEVSRFDLCQKSGQGIWPELAQALANQSIEPAATGA